MTPHFQETPLRCANCGHEWHGHMAVQCPLDVALASMKAIIRAGCPACGSNVRGTVLLVLKP
jgi:hypothetical protein